MICELWRRVVLWLSYVSCDMVDCELWRRVLWRIVCYDAVYSGGFELTRRVVVGLSFDTV